MPSLSLFPPSNPAVPLPSSIQRSFLQTPSGKLELLSAEPPNSYVGERKTPIFFAHGGCGSAPVWCEWMTFLSQSHNIPCYAVSYRGHGGSWYPWYLRMFFTSKRTLANDLVAGVRHVQEHEAKFSGAAAADIVLVAHSNGGGLAQVALAAGDIRVAGLALVAATPAFGSEGVNKNWAQLDPWFTWRMFFRHLGNPMSPLSSTALVKQAFFCAEYPVTKVERFRQMMPTYESFAWPLGLFFRIVDARDVLANVYGWRRGAKRQGRVFILAGAEDKLMSPDLMAKQAAEYRAGFSRLVEAGKVESLDEDVTEFDESHATAGHGVRYAVVKGAGHHLQNDLQWQEGAKTLLAWYDSL